MTARAPPHDVLRLLAAHPSMDEADLARDLDMTVAAVRESVAWLCGQGVPIHVDSARRCSLPWPVQMLDADAICARTACDGAGTTQVHWELDSTSSELARHRDELADLSVVLAERQTAGRGRIGRSWMSPPALNLCMSCLKRFEHSLSGLSLAVGVMVAEALEAMGMTDVGLKWPNDLIARDRKLAGVLVEIAGANRTPATAIIGVGVNVRLPEAVREGIQQPVVDLAELAMGAAPDRNVLAAHVITRLRMGLTRFAGEGFDAFAAGFAQRDWLRGKTLSIQGPHGTEVGIGAGVDHTGALRVRTANGEIRVDSARDIKVRVK